MKTLEIANYIPRIADEEISELMKVFGAVVIEGPKWCGKTTTAKSHALSETSMADPHNDFQARRIAELDPALALEGPRPRLIDEWQDVPKLWDAVRYECDKAPDRGQFILTGSSSPKKRKTAGKEQPKHSGAGRMARVPMGTMTQQEMGRSSGAVSIRGLFKGEAGKGLSELSLKDVASLVVKGGWPAAIDLPPDAAARIARGYLQAVIEEDIHEVDGVERDKDKVRKLIASLARNESTLASNKTLMRDARDPGATEEALTAPTLNEYLDALRRLYFVQDILPWAPSVRSSVRIRSAVKRHLADPSLAAASLGVSVEALIQDLETLGFLFESLVAHDLIAYAGAMGAQVRHYHDDKDLEADLILEADDGSWVPVEVKLGASQVDAAAKNLLAVKDKLERAGYRPPSALLVIVGVGGIAAMRDDGVQVATLDTLGI